MRRSSVCAAAMALLLLLYVPVIISARQISRSHLRDGHDPAPAVANTEDMDRSKVGKESLYYEAAGRMATKGLIRGPDTVLQVQVIAGSRLPDCSHACGSCSPCRLVMVSFVCASLAEAETCPMAYKCMCHNKSYPVP